MKQTLPTRTRFEISVGIRIQHSLTAYLMLTVYMQLLPPGLVKA